MSVHAITVTPSITRRFWKYTDTSSGPESCWEWIASRMNGYGSLSDHDDHLYAHRVSYTIHHGLIPDGMDVLHNCPNGDNPACVNPSHLYLGNHSDNMRDMVAKGRQRTLFISGEEHWSHLHPERVIRGDAHYSRQSPDKMARGERHGLHLHPERIARGEHAGRSKLTEQQVREIRFDDQRTQREKATHYGVHIRTIAAIEGYETWKHIT